MRYFITKRLTAELPPSRQVEFDIDLKPGAKPSSRSPFRLSKTEQDSLESFVSELMQKGWIEISDSPWVSNIFGIPKKNQVTGKAPSRAQWLRSGDPSLPIRWVIDYRYVNSQTNIPKIPLPNIKELFDRMAHAKLFTTIDLAQGYHQRRVSTRSKKLIAFRTKNEIYQWCVAPMGLSGMPGIWSRLMRVLFGKFDFAVVYLDDICVFSSDLKSHLIHLKAIFEVLRKEKLYARTTKCEFGKESIDFLGHTISCEGLHVDIRKIRDIEQRAAPINKKDLLSFLGLAGYYR